MSNRRTIRRIDDVPENEQAAFIAENTAVPAKRVTDTMERQRDLYLARLSAIRTVVDSPSANYIPTHCLTRIREILDSVTPEEL